MHRPALTPPWRLRETEQEYVLILYSHMLIGLPITKPGWTSLEQELFYTKYMEMSSITVLIPQANRVLFL